MALFPSNAWLETYKDRINASSEYRAAAETWEGDVAFLLEAEPDRNVPDDLWAWLDLWHGACRTARMVSPEEGRAAQYVISAPYSRWKQVLAGELDPVKGMMQGKLKLDGDLPTIIRYVRAANQLVLLTMSVPTEYVDDEAAGAR